MIEQRLSSTTSRDMKIHSVNLCSSARNDFDIRLPSIIMLKQVFSLYNCHQTMLLYMILLEFQLKFDKNQTDPILIWYNLRHGESSREFDFGLDFIVTSMKHSDQMHCIYQNEKCEEDKRSGCKW